MRHPAAESGVHPGSTRKYGDEIHGALQPINAQSGLLEHAPPGR